MKTVKRSKVYLLVVALVLVLSMTVGLTMAYFSDHTEAKGGMKVALGGHTKIEEKQFDDKKEISIVNIGDTDVVVRVAAYGPFEIGYDGSDWTYVEDPVTKKGYCYYNYVLPAGETASTLTASWKIPAGTDLGDDYNVVVIQESDQAVYKDGKVMTPATDPAWLFDKYAN